MQILLIIMYVCETCEILRLSDNAFKTVTGKNYNLFNNE